MDTPINTLTDAVTCKFGAVTRKILPQHNGKETIGLAQ